MSGFLFDGRSRPNRMQLARDTHLSKDRLLDEAHKRQQRREEERRRASAAGRIQRTVRGFLAQQRLLRLAVEVLDRLPEASPQPPRPSETAAPLTPRQLGTVCWCFRCLQTHTRRIPLSVLAEEEPTSDTGTGAATSGAVTRANRAARAKALVRRCSGKLVAAVREVLQQQRRAPLAAATGGAGGGFRGMLAELPSTAVGFLVFVLLDDYASSLAEKKGSSAEAAFRGLEELCQAAVSAAASEGSGAAIVEEIVCSCLRFSTARLTSVQTARNRLLGLLSPLLPLCAPAVAASTQGEAGEERHPHGYERQPEAAAAGAPRPLAGPSGLWAEACWAALSSSSDDSYLPLTSTPAAALLSAEEPAGGGSRCPQAAVAVDGSTAMTTVLLMVVAVAYDRIIRHSFMDVRQPALRSDGAQAEASELPASASLPASPSATSARWWEPSAMAVLGRLTRLLPLFLTHGDADGDGDARHRLARAAWLRCVGVLCARLCQTEAFTRSILFDLHHSRLQLMSQGKKPQESDVAAAVAGAHRGGKYRSLASHLFSSEGGLRLMEQLATFPAAPPSAPGAGNEEEEAAPQHQATPARAARYHFLPAAEEAQLLSLNTLEAVCGVYAWPLFTFSLSSPQHRLETAAVFAKLVHTPQLLRQMWCLYRRRCEGLAALLPPGELLERLCAIAAKPNAAVRMPYWQPPPAELLAEKGLRGRQGMFWDPNPAFAALFFTLLSYYVDVTDFAQDLARETVLTQRECWGLILALKEIVHRAHLHGVVPGESCEAVAHLAYMLLGKLHVINESSPFAPFPSLWISTTDQGVMRALGGVTPPQWEALSEKRAEEQRRLEKKMDGGGDEEDNEGTDEESDSGRHGLPSSVGVTAHYLSVKHNPERARAANAAAAAAAAARRQRCPGDDLVFEESAGWPLEERVVRLLLHAPFMIPFPERAALLTMFLINSQPPRMPGRPNFFVVHRGRTFVDTFERFHAKPDSPDMYSVRFAAAPGAGTRSTRGGGGGGDRRGGGGERRRAGLMGRLRSALGAHGDEEDEDGDGNAEEEEERPHRGQGRVPRRENHGNDDWGEDGGELQEEGLEEGYGQGVYRELMVSLCKEGFDAAHGLFQQTEDSYVYPNPFSFEATGDPLHLLKISFLGTMVGRAFRDGILQDYPFALHFRNALLSRRNSINNLRSFDAQLYQQLISLGKMNKEELEGMGLTFTYDVNALGITREVELIKGGATVQVTQSNCLHYIQLVADFKLNREGAQQTQAFKAGLEAIIRPSWLQLFDSNELLNLLGGDRSGKIDLADWREHTTYYPTEAKNSQPVKLFWDVVTSLTSEQQSKLLKFATSMNRPPLLGFRFLSPPFNIHMLPEAAIDRLPSASTCFSMLKLPPYKDYAAARVKIIAAIEETNSFGLT